MSSDPETILLEFVPNPGEEEEGLGHAGIQTYRQAPYAGVARETGQNSRDAFAEMPVRISYDVVDIQTESLPCISDLQWVVDKCLADATNAGKEKETKFFDNARKILAKPALKLLRIADSNTLGARGPSISGTPFYSLTKGSGVSVKGNAASGGSFGIGKNAAFAASDIQAVFYSTVYKEPDSNAHRFLAQGKVVLVSHLGADGQQKRQTGYWGAKGFKPLGNPADVPEWARRTVVGTTVHVLGFLETPQWQEKFSLALIQNFFPAIHRGEMEFHLDGGKLAIGKASLPTLLADNKLRAVAKAEGREHDFDLAACLYRCLTSSETTEKLYQLPELGEVSIRVLVAEGLPKKVVLTRNGMVITDSLEHFGDKLARFPMYRDFVALVTPVDERGSEFIKKLEDPRHSALSAEGLASAADRDRARIVMKRLAERIREAIKANALTQFESEVPVDELREFFATESTGENCDRKGDLDDPERLTYKVAPPKLKQPSGYSTGEGSTGGGVGGGDPGPGPHGAAGTVTDSASESRHGAGGSHSLKRIALQGVRNVMHSGSASGRSLFFTASESGMADLAVFATGLNTPDLIGIRSSDHGEVQRGRVKLAVVAGERMKLSVDFEEPYSGPLDLRMNLVSNGAPE